MIIYIVRFAWVTNETISVSVCDTLAKAESIVSNIENSDECKVHGTLHYNANVNDLPHVGEVFNAINLKQEISIYKREVN